jgi:hypothetical protein
MAQSEQRSWWRRNWKWFVPAMSFGTVAFMVVLYFVLAATFRSSWAYSEGVNLARSNSTLIGELGEPIKTGWLVTGSIKIEGPSGSAELAIPLSGPRNTATLYVIARKRAEKWQFDLAEVEVPGRETRIDLLAGG